MTKMCAHVVLLAGSLVVATIVGCCATHKPGPGEVIKPPRIEYVQCRHPDVDDIRDCLAKCPKAPDPARPGRVEGCCGTIRTVPGTEQDRDALRKCFPECRTAELQGGQQSPGGNP